MSDFDIASRISVSDDELRKAFDDDLKALANLARQAKQFGGDAAGAFAQAAEAQAALMDQVGATGAQYDKLRSLVDGVNAKVEQGGTISRSAAIGAGELARGLGRIAQSGNVSAFALRELTGAAFRLGESLGSSGVAAGIGIAVIAVASIVETFSKWNDEIVKTEQLLDDLAQEHVRLLAESVHNELAVKELGLAQQFEKEMKQIEAEAPGRMQRIWSEIMTGLGVATNAPGALAEGLRYPMQLLRVAAAQHAAAANLLQADKNALQDDLDKRNKKHREPREPRDPYLRNEETLERFPHVGGLGVAGIPKDFMSDEMAALSADLTPDKDQAKADQFQLQRFVQGSIASLKAGARETAQEWKVALDTITNVGTNMVDGLLRGTTTLRGAFQNLWSDAVIGAVNAGIRILAHHVAIELGMTEATATGTATRSSLDEWAAAKKVAVNAWAALTSIANYAWEAVAATWAAISAIPFVGPFLAPAMAAGAGAGILALIGDIRSAAGGFDIPSGMNPMTQLHAREMVLPAELADKVRGMTGGGGDTHVHVYAWDSQSLEDFARRNPGFFGTGTAGALNSNHTGLRRAFSKKVSG